MMKQTLMTTLVAMALTAMAPINPELSWERTELDLGEITKNEEISLRFNFTNDSESPVIIQSAKGSCGCTEVMFSGEPIAPGEKSAVSAKFKSGKTGVFAKTIKVRTNNSADPVVLRFKGEIVN